MVGHLVSKQIFFPKNNVIHHDSSPTIQLYIDSTAHQASYLHPPKYLPQPIHPSPLPSHNPTPPPPPPPPPTLRTPPSHNLPLPDIKRTISNPSHPMRRMQILKLRTARVRTGARAPHEAVAAGVGGACLGAHGGLTLLGVVWGQVACGCGCWMMDGMRDRKREGCCGGRVICILGLDDHDPGRLDNAVVRSQRMLCCEVESSIVRPV